MTIPHRSGRRRCAARRPARCRPLYRTALLGSDIVAAAHLAEGPMIKCSLGPRQQRLGTTHPHCRSARTAKVLDSNRWHLRSMYIHMWSASSSESMALLVLSDAESDSDCPKDPLVFGREPANLKPRSRAGLTGPRGPHKPVRSFPSFRFQAAWRPNAAPARTGRPHTG